MTYFVERVIDEQGYEALLTAAQEVDPEWCMIVRLGYRAGIKTGLGRHLSRDDFSKDCVLLGHRLSKAVLRRKLPDDVLKALRSLPESQHYICPRLHTLTTEQFANEWREVCKAAGIKVQMITLTWRYRRDHKDSIKLERGMSYLEKLAKTWLKVEKVEELWTTAKEWVLFPPKRNTRGQYRTRRELLARSGGLQ
jgi:hypothetical protein